MKAPTVKRASPVKSITPKSVTPEPRIRSRVGHWILGTVATAAAIGLGGTLCAQEPPQEPLVIPPIEELPIPDSPATAEPTASQPSPVRPGLPSQPDAVNGKQAAPLQLAPPAGKPKAPIVITPRKPVPTVKPAPVPADGVFSNGASNSVPNIPLPTSNQAVGGGGYLGLVAEPLQGGGFGLNVVDVTSQSPAWKAGFRVGDRIVGVGGQAVTSLDQLAQELDHYGPGSPVKFLVQRLGRSTNLTAVLQDRLVAGQIQGGAPGTALPLQAPKVPTPKTPYLPISPNLADSRMVDPGSNGFDPAIGASRGSAVLGVAVSDLSESFRKRFGIPLFRGAAVSNVTPNSTAEIAGLQPGDCISEIDGQQILRAEDVVEAVRNVALGGNITIGYYRGNQKQLVEVPLVTPVLATQSPDGVAPEVVASLQQEIQRLQQELASAQARVVELEKQLAPRQR